MFLNFWYFHKRITRNTKIIKQCLFKNMFTLKNEKNESSDFWNVCLIKSSAKDLIFLNFQPLLWFFKITKIHFFLNFPIFSKKTKAQKKKTWIFCIIFLKYVYKNTKSSKKWISVFSIKKIRNFSKKEYSEFYVFFIKKAKNEFSKFYVFWIKKAKNKIDFLIFTIFCIKTAKSSEKKYELFISIFILKDLQVQKNPELCLNFFFLF